MKKFKDFGVILILITSFLLHLNNINLYNPDFGFDGKDHQEYIEHIYQNKNIPLPHQGWEFNQPPLYYITGAIFKTLQTNPQFVNLIVLYIILATVYFFTRSSLAVMAIVSLPILNYFPPLITNELLAGLFLIAGLLILTQKKLNPFVLILVLVAGFYTKYTALTLLPLIPLAYFLQTKSFLQTIKKTLLIYSIFFIAILPILYRNFFYYGKPLVLATDFYEFSQPKINKNLAYFTRFDWIYRQDLFKAKNYSFTGGLWNTFWHDGEQVIVPVTEFHKKAWILWLLGFPLFLISLYGLYRRYLVKPKSAIILFAYIFIAFVSLVSYGLKLPYNFVTKSFYAFGLVIPYIIGIKQATLTNQKIKFITIFLLLIQFLIMASYFWIHPYWHNVKL